MAEKPRTVPGARSRGPKPKLEHPMQTLGRVLGFVGKKYWLHLIVVVIAIVVSVLSMVHGHPVHQDPHRQLYPAPGEHRPGRRHCRLRPA